MISPESLQLFGIVLCRRALASRARFDYRLAKRWFCLAPRGGLPMSLTANIDLKDLVRTIPDYPKPGIMFRDITTLLGHADGFQACVDQLVRPFSNQRVESVAGIEARGFILGGAVADRLHCRFIPIRKKGKL